MIDGTLADFRVKLVVIHFEGKALQWHTSFVKTLPESNLPKWTKFTNILIDRFGEVCDDPMAELMQLRQNQLVIKQRCGNKKSAWNTESRQNSKRA